MAYDQFGRPITPGLEWFVQQQPPPPPPTRPEIDWGKVFLFVAGTVAAVAVLDAVFDGGTGKGGGWDDDDDDRGLSSRDRLARNRELGAGFEAVAADALAEAFPTATIIPQVRVVTPFGQARRVDYVVARPNGSATAAEVKCVPVLRESHVVQAEDHREGLKHTHGVRSGRPLVVVREDTYVSDDHAARVRIVRI